MKTIEVKDSEWYRAVYDMPNKVRVYVGETKAEHEARRKAEYDKIMINREMGYSGFDEHNDGERA